MKNRESIFLTKYIISAYDGEVNQAIFSSLEKAVEYCNSSENKQEFVENPLNDACGWLIEKYTLDNPKIALTFYNQNGKEIVFEPEKTRKNKKI